MEISIRQRKLEGNDVIQNFSYKSFQSTDFYVQATPPASGVKIDKVYNANLSWFPYEWNVGFKLVKL